MLSFKINKKSSAISTPVQKTTPVQSSKRAAFNDDEEREEETDFIHGLEGSNIVSKKQKKTEKKELVIPLITKNEWRLPEKKQRVANGVDESGADGSSLVVATGNSNGAPTTDEPEPDSLRQQAIKELLEGSSSATVDEKSIPILFQNRIPAGYEEDENMDVSLRPDQSSLDDYERIPIEEFGLAMLRGMGWKETEGIGLKNKKVVDMAEPKLRPKGMGLGAESAHLNKDVAPKSANTKNEEKEDLSFRIGGYAIITRGSKKGYYGQIESFDEDNNRVILRLSISGQMEAISKFYINVVSSKEYKKSSKVINSEKYEEYKKKQDIAEQKRKRKEESHHRGDSDEIDSSSNEDVEVEYRSKSRSSRRSEERDSKHDSNHKEKRSDRDKGKERKDDRRDRKEKRDRRDDKDRDSRKYEDRDRRQNYDRNDDHYRNSSRNGDRRSDHHRRTDDRRGGHYYKDSRD